MHIRCECFLVSHDGGANNYNVRGGKVVCRPMMRETSDRYRTNNMSAVVTCVLYPHTLKRIGGLYSRPRGRNRFSVGGVGGPNLYPQDVHKGGKDN